MKNIIFIFLLLISACKSTNQKVNTSLNAIEKPKGNWQMLDYWRFFIEKDGQIEDSVMIDTMDYITSFCKYYFLNDSDLVVTSFALHNDSNIFRSPCIYQINGDTLKKKCYIEGNRENIYNETVFFSVRNNILLLLSPDFDELSIWVKFRKDQAFSKQDFNRIRDSLNQHFSVLDFVIETGKQKGKKLYYKR